MIWEAQKDVFFKRYRNQGPRVVDFDTSIAQYIELSNNVQQVDTITAVDFVLLDCSGLKLGIIGHCDEWQNRFHALLHEMASEKLSSIYTQLEENTKRCSVSECVGMCKCEGVSVYVCVRVAIYSTACVCLSESGCV